MTESIPYAPVLTLDEIREQVDNYLPLLMRKRHEMTPQLAYAIGQRANDLRIPITTGLNEINIIPGKKGDSISVSANLIHSLVMRSQKLADMKVEFFEHNKNGITCKVWLKRTNGFEFEFEFSEADAEDADLIEKDNWQKYLRNMLLWRALKVAEQVLFPEITDGMYSPDEMGSSSEVFDAIDVSDAPVKASAQKNPSQPSDEWRAVFEQTWDDAADEGVNVMNVLNEYNEEKGRDADAPLEREDLIALTRLLSYAMESVF